MLSQEVDTLDQATRTLLAILAKQRDGRVNADSVKDSAGNCLGLMYKPGLFGRSHKRRVDKMERTIKHCSDEGLVEYISDNKGHLKITDDGRRRLSTHRRAVQRTA